MICKISGIHIVLLSMNQCLASSNFNKRISNICFSFNKALSSSQDLRLDMCHGMHYDGMIGVHYDGIFYEFVPWNGVVSWEISQWGYWYMAAENGTHLVELETTTKDLGTTLRAPTAEAGLAPACKDTCYGVLKLQMWERRYDGTKGKLILDVTSAMAAVEVGEGPWFNTWKGKTTTPKLVKTAVGEQSAVVSANGVKCRITVLL